MDLVEVVLADPHRHRLEAELDEAAALVQMKRRVITGGDGQLNDFQRRMLLRFPSTASINFSPSPR